MFVLWVGHFIIFKGCVVTHMENWFSRKIYKMEFRPEYTLWSNNIIVILKWIRDKIICLKKFLFKKRGS